MRFKSRKETVKLLTEQSSRKKSRPQKSCIVSVDGLSLTGISFGSDCGNNRYSADMTLLQTPSKQSGFHPPKFDTYLRKTGQTSMQLEKLKVAIGTKIVSGSWTCTYLNAFLIGLFTGKSGARRSSFRTVSIDIVPGEDVKLQGKFITAVDRWMSFIRK